jgi:RND family efflux transporter MFP subunit
MKKHVTTVSIIFIVLALALGAVLLRKHRMAAVLELDTVGEIPWALHTAEVVRGNLSRGFPALATLTGSTDITISSQLSGLIEAMGPREGVKVQQGEVLARISAADLQHQREGLAAQREAALADQKRTHDEYERQLQLKKKGLTTDELVEAKYTAGIAADKQVANLDKQLEAMDVRIGYGTVYAPRDAIVAARLVEVGDVAQPGKPLYRLTVDSAARLRVNLPQQVLEQVRPGTRVELESGSRKMTVELSRIFPALDIHALGAAEADLPAMPFDLPSGARIPARVLLETVEDAISIPHRALVRTGNKGFLFKIESGSDGKTLLKRVPVRIVLDANEGLAVAGDLKAGDQVVVAHQSVLMQLRDGDPASIRPTAATGRQL